MKDISKNSRQQEARERDYQAAKPLPDGEVQTRVSAPADLRKATENMLNDLSPLDPAVTMQVREDRPFDLNVTPVDMAQARRFIRALRESLASVQGAYETAMEKLEAGWDKSEPLPAPDLDELEALALAADQGEGQHIYTHPRDSNGAAANEAWHRAASPEVIMQLIAIARRAQP